jgi:uncharacterized protein (TIGR03437 family)
LRSLYYEWTKIASALQVIDMYTLDPSRLNTGGIIFTRGMLRRPWALFLVCAVRLFSATAPISIPLPANSIANAVRLDASGNLYLAGFYFANPLAANSPAHAFVAKLSPDASQILWWTPLAGSKDDRAQALVLGPGNSVYVTGITQSADFPATPGAFDPADATAGNTFSAKLDANGAVVYATYIPASSGQSIAVDGAGDAFITGRLSSGDALKATPDSVAGAPNGSGFTSQSAFIIELDPAGSRAMLAIIGFGGTQIALDGSGNIYAAGYFLGPVAPTTPGAFQAAVTARTCGSSQISVETCAYQHIAKIDSTGTRLIYATYLSGTLGAIPTGLAVDNAGNAIIAGTTSSPDYPTTPGAYQPEYFGNPSSQLQLFTLSPPASAGYVTKLNATGTGLLWSTLFGGSGGQIPNSLIVGDSIAGMAIDASGNILVAGFANSPDLPGLWNTQVASRPVAANESNGSGFVARLSADGGRLSPVQLLNGLQRDLPEPTGGAIAVRADGSAIVAGEQVFTVSISSLGRVAAICDAADDAKIVRVAPGQLMTLYGMNLAPLGVVPASPVFPTSFNGVAVTFNGTAAPLFYTSSTQINLQVPYEIASQGQVIMQVSSQSVSPAISESYILAVAAREPGVFIGSADFSAPLADAATCNGQIFAGLQPLAVNADGSINSCSNPAAPGSTVTVFLNGLGGTTPAQVTGAIELSTVAVSPTALLVPGTGPAGVLPTFTLAGAISSVAQVQVQAGATSAVINLDVGASANAAYSVRGPGIVIWAGQPSLPVHAQLNIGSQPDSLFRRKN